MAIYQRDRDFQQIFAEIDIDVVPLKFIKDITCVLSDGRKIVLDEDDLREADEDNSNDLENLIKQLDFYGELSDLNVRINYDLVEKRVEADVDRILSKREK